jgi:hypothetical protein
VRDYPKGTLLDLIRKEPNAPLVEEEQWNLNLIVSFMRDLASAASAMHQTGFAHNNITVAFSSTNTITRSLPT